VLAAVIGVTLRSNLRVALPSFPTSRRRVSSCRLERRLIELREAWRQTLLRRIALALALLVPTIAYSQDERKNELGLLLGATVTPAIQTGGPASGNLAIGTGITFQVTYARQLSRSRTSSLYFEVPALAVPLQNITASVGAVPRNYDSFFVTPALRLKIFPRRRLSPWFSAGGGYALFDESAQRIDGVHNSTRGTSGGAAEFGGGVDLRTPIKFLVPLGLRLEVRDLYTSKPTYNIPTGDAFQNNVVFSGGLVLHF
jgi:hypothetical protein